MTIEALEGFTPEQLALVNAKIAETYISKAEFEAVRSKADELLTETKMAKAAQKKALEDANNIKIQEAAKNNDLETYKKSYEEKILGLTTELDGIKTASKKQKITMIANEFVKDKFTNDKLIAEAITEKFSSRVDIRDGKEVILDKDGNLTALSLQDLQNEFLNNDSYKAHVISSKASGGGASGSGNNKGGGASKMISKQQFDALDPSQKMEYMKTVKTFS